MLQHFVISYVIQCDCILLQQACNSHVYESVLVLVQNGRFSIQGSVKITFYIYKKLKPLMAHNLTLSGYRFSA
jgi:hypothetical protein